MGDLFELDHPAGYLKLYVKRRELKREGPSIFWNGCSCRVRCPMVRRDALPGSRNGMHGRFLASLVEKGILGSEAPKGPISLPFPSNAGELLFPRLFGEV